MCIVYVSACVVKAVLCEHLLLEKSSRGFALFLGLSLLKCGCSHFTQALFYFFNQCCFCIISFFGKPLSHLGVLNPYWSPFGFVKRLFLLPLFLMTDCMSLC